MLQVEAEELGGRAAARVGRCHAESGVHGPKATAGRRGLLCALWRI